MKFFILVWILFSLCFSSNAGFVTSNGMGYPIGFICEDDSGVDLHLMPRSDQNYYHDLKLVQGGEELRVFATHLGCQADPPNSTRSVFENDCWSLADGVKKFAVETRIVDGRLITKGLDRVSGRSYLFSHALDRCRIEKVD